MIRGGYVLPHYCHDATRWTGDDDEGHGKVMSRRTVGELPPCQYSAATTNTIALCHATLRHGEQGYQPTMTMMMIMPERKMTPRQDRKFNYLLQPPSGCRPLGLVSKGAYSRDSIQAFVLNQGIWIQIISQAVCRASAWTSIIPCVFECRQNVS